MYISALTLVGAFVTASAAPQKLTKLPVQYNLDNLKQGLVDNLPVTQSTTENWEKGWMPEVCKVRAQEENQNPVDFEIVKVKYDDVRSMPSACPFPKGLPQK